MKSKSPLFFLPLILGVAPLAAQSVSAPAAPPAPNPATVHPAALQLDFAVKDGDQPVSSATLQGDPAYGSRYEGVIRLDVPGRETWQIVAKLHTTEYDRRTLLRIDIYDADRISSDYCENAVPLFSTVRAYRGTGTYQLFARDGTNVSVTVRDDLFTRPFFVRTGRPAAPQKAGKPPQ